MKPLHEETFRLTRAGPDGAFSLVASDGRMVAQTREFDGERIARRLASSAAMARALLAARQQLIALGATRGEEWEDIEAALREAEVPLPGEGQ